MMRRLLQTPVAQRPRRRQFSSALGAAGGKIPQRDGCLGVDTVPALQFDGPPRNILPSSSAFAIRSLSTRQHSSEAMSSLSTSNTLGYNDFFGVHREGGRDVMLSPFQGEGEGSPEKVFLELFKAISTLERQSHSAASVSDVGENEVEEADAPSLSELNGADVMGLGQDGSGERRVDAHIATTSSTNEDAAAEAAKLDTSDDATAPPITAHAKPKLSEVEAKARRSIQSALRDALKKDELNDVLRIFDEYRSNPNKDLLSKRDQTGMFQYLLRRDTRAACEVWAYHEAQCRAQRSQVHNHFYGDIFERDPEVFLGLVRADADVAASILRRHETVSSRRGGVVDVKWYAALLDTKTGVGRDAFNELVDKNIGTAFEMLKYHVEQRKEEGRLVDLDLYGRLLTKIRYVEVEHADGKWYEKRAAEKRMTAGALKELAEDVARHLHEEYPDGSKKAVYRHLLLPILVGSLVEHKHRWINACAKPLVERILDDPTFPQLCPELFEHMLGIVHEGKTGPNYAPYHRVLTWLVSSGYRPKPESVRKLLQCYRPFADTKAVHEMLVAIKTLHSGSDQSLTDAEDYRVDLGTLEAISLAASAASNIDLNLLCWDLVDMFGYQPTEGMFEDVVLSFSVQKYSDEDMFAALVDMEGNGYLPSRALLKNIALKMSGVPRRLSHAEHKLMWHENEHVRSTHTLNALLMGYGMRGNIDAAFRVFESFPKNGLQPDENTFTFLMEVLYIDTKNRFPLKDNQASVDSPEDIEDVLGAAQIILDSMEGAGVAATKLFYHEQIRVLCALGLLEDAKMLVEEAVAVGTPLPVATLYLLATRLAHAGNYQMAHAVADLSAVAGCGDGTSIANRIRNIEKRRENEVNHGVVGDS
ncbi:hypothetical protein ACHAXT_007820 [Thalassiosira profunda]